MLCSPGSLLLISLISLLKAIQEPLNKVLTPFGILHPSFPPPLRWESNMSHLLSTRDSLDDFNNPQYAQYYQYLALCQEHSCPDAYYDFTDHCTVQICPIDSSNYNYLPSLAANAVFIALFGVSLACFLGQGLLSRRFIGFTVVMVCGDILEVLGYAGRIMSHNNPWLQVGRHVQEIAPNIPC